MEKKLLALSLACLLLAGCGGPESPGISASSGSQSGEVPEDSSQAAPPEVQYQVQTDWSVLEGGASEPLPPAVGRRWYPDYTDHLIPSGSYGTLIPFAGARVYTKAWWEEDGGYTSPAFLYGLMTAEGKVVMDPVCTAIYRLSYPLDNGDYAALPVLRLERGDKQQGDPENGSLVAIAAADGRWNTGFLYWGCAAGPNSLLAGNQEGLSLISPGSGEVVKTWTWADVGVSDPASVPWFTGDAYSSVQWADGRFFLGCYGADWDQARFLDPLSGEVTATPAQDWYQALDQRYANLSWWTAERMADDTYTLTLGDETHRLTSPLELGDQLPYVAGEDRVIFNDGKGSFAVTTLGGKTVLPPQEGTVSVLQDSWEEGGSWLAVQSPEGDQWTLYDWNGNQSSVLPALGSGWCSMAGPLVEVYGENCSAYYQPKDGTCVYRTYFGLDGESLDPEV